VRDTEHVLALAGVGHVGLDFLHDGGSHRFFRVSLRERCGTREVSEVRDRATETRAEANARRVFARALSRWHGEESARTMMFLLCLLRRPSAQKRGRAGAFGDALEARDEAPRQNGPTDTSWYVGEN
jgi:hypothetical protein